MFGWFASDTVRSGTQEHPTPEHVFRALVAELAEAQREEPPGGSPTLWVRFERCRKSAWLRTAFRLEPAWAEVAAEPAGLALNLALPREDGDLLTTIQRHAMPLPATWLPRHQRWHRNPVIDVPTVEWPAVPPWLDRYFRGPLGCPADYSVKGWFDG